MSLYLDLLKRVLTNVIYRDPPVHRPVGPMLYMHVADPSYDEVTRSLGEDWPTQAHTMSGLRRLDNLHRCADDVVSSRIPGDFVEAGVWRGGAVAFLQAFLRENDITDRTVWAADTFAGVPAPAGTGDHDDEWTAINDILAVDAEQVRETLRRYALDDGRVRFLQGRFRDTLPAAPVERIALLHVDSGTYEGTKDTLTYLYPKLSPGGYAVIGDYVALGPRRAVSEFRQANGIRPPLRTVDHLGVYWANEQV
jgi:hypothetical protein